MTGGEPAFRPWQVAWSDALYGPAGFYRRPEGPAGHFRTAAHASRSGLLGAAVARLARRSGCTAVLDVGAGRGELLAAVHAADTGLHCTGVEVVPRPAGLVGPIGWRPEAQVPDAPTLLLGWELLDVVPVPVLEVDRHGRLRVVEVAADGAQRLGGLPSPADEAWCRRWWPPAGTGSRVEVGAPREAVWSALVDLLDGPGGVALAVDYGHDRADRPAGGTLTGYRRGRVVDPVPDGTADLTAHVALDALAAARPDAVRTSQRTALAGLGLPPPRPDHRLAGRDPRAYLSALTAAGEAAELRDPAGLGAFGWVLHPVGDRCADALGRVVATWTEPTPA